MQQISCTGCPSLSPVILVQATVEICVTARNQEKITKNQLHGFQGHSKVTDVSTPRMLVSSACYEKQQVCV